MKTRLFTLLSTLALATTMSAAEPDKAAIPTPNGGRLLSDIDPQAEFLVTPERKVQITFLDAAGKPIAPAEQEVSVLCGDRSNPTRLEFAREGEVLISTSSLPDGNGFPTIVQVKTTPDAKTVRDKFNLNLSICPGCQLSEYACTCGH